MIFRAFIALLSLTPVVAQGQGQGGRRTLQILHSSDNESSFQDPNDLEEKVVNYADIVAYLQFLSCRENIPSIHVTVGDHTIPGPFYQASTEVPRFGKPGLADIAMFNSMNLLANAIGNHEFDGSSVEFTDMLQAANYPFISVNLDFSNSAVPIPIGPDAVDCTLVGGMVTKSCYVETEIGKIGLIGRSPADFFNVIEDPPTNLPGIDFFGGRDENNQPLESAIPQVLAQVDLLEAQGVDIIFLLDHAQDFTGDPLSTTSLRGIDVIIAAGTTGFMARPYPSGPFNLLRSGDSAEADYPTERQDSLGDTVLVINSDQQFFYVGQLIVHFDKNGKIQGYDGRSGPIATTEQALDLLEGVLNKEFIQNVGVNVILDLLQNTPSIQESFAVVGQTDFPLNGNRADVRSRETNLGRLAADSTLDAARAVVPGTDIALKNGGGIRDTIEGPSIIRLTVEAALAFDNKLTIRTLTAEQVLAMLENSVSRVPALDGRFPQLAGVVMEYDASMPGVQNADSLSTASRVKSAIITKADGTTDNLVTNFAFNAALSGTPYVLATNSFLGTGGDGYASIAAAPELVETTQGEQDILVDYISNALGGVVSIEGPPSNPRVAQV